MSCRQCRVDRHGCSHVAAQKEKGEWAHERARIDTLKKALAKVTPTQREADRGVAAASEQRLSQNRNRPHGKVQTPGRAETTLTVRLPADSFMALSEKVDDVIENISTLKDELTALSELKEEVRMLKEMLSAGFDVHLSPTTASLRK